MRAFNLAKAGAFHQLRFLFVCLCLFAGLLQASSAQAALRLELTKGIYEATPIAVVPFAGSSPVNITNIIRADLQNSGYFRALANKDMPAKPHSRVDVNYKQWRKTQADNLVVGAVRATADGRYNVTMQLLDVYLGLARQQGNPNAASPVLLSLTFTVKAQALRALAHHMSNLIYEKLTGEKGIFNTRIAYVVVRPKGKQKVYTLEVADYDGYNTHRLLVSPEPIMSPAWAPNGRQLAYVSFEKKRAAIYVMDIITGKRKRLMAYPGINGAPAFSPDGRQLALVLSKSGHPKIYIYSFESQRLKQITFGSAIDTEPAWSPDGRSLLFTSDRGGAPQIYRLSLAGGKPKRVTFVGDYNARSSFTPDGKAIVMLHRQGGLFNIALQTLATGDVRVLTQSGMDESPSIAPNGKMVVYGSRYGGRSLLGEVSTDGRVKLRLPAQAGDVQEPAWGPF